MRFATTMDAADFPDAISLYPEPTIVVGVGRFGLSVLERLGADWRWLNDAAGDDPSLKNLRLLAVRSDDGVDHRRWIRPDAELASVARAAGEDDLPSLAVHFAIIRSLGLIRFRDGTYQFALPRDSGVVETTDHQTTRRRRYFEWLVLDSDPIRAVDRLHRLAAENPRVDLFVTPIVERVSHGQSPRLLLHLIARCRALLEGRDPSPWSWTHEVLPGFDAISGAATSVDFDSGWLTDDDRSGFLDGLVPPPLQPPPTPHDDGAAPSADIPWQTLAMCVPRHFAPRPGDLATPLAPRRLLRIDWETSGWVAGELDDQESVEFRPVDASPFRLGFFDHDDAPPADPDTLSERLETLGRRVHQGLLRLWLDLHHEREEISYEEGTHRRRAGADDAVEQCLELLGELVVPPLLGDDAGETSSERPESRTDRWVDGAPLSDRPSSELAATIVDRETTTSMPDRPLLERLTDLGLPFDELDLGERPLFRDLTFGPSELDESGRMTPLRRAVNEETRHLVSFDHLKDYRQQPTRRPPRLTIYVVGDVKEPFSRRAFRPVLRALHQELMRGYGPLFDTSRDGFDRPLSIVPVVWSPHPADAFGGDHPEPNLIEEASILDAVHNLRRWVEALPANRRCIPQIFVNSRVTDSAVLGLDEAARQTRDFLSFQIRNELATDSWLRQTAVGFTSDDLFSTFSCVEIDFPAERAREYLATRLGREALGRLQEAGRGADVDVDEDELPRLERPDDELVDPARRRLRQMTARAAGELSADVDDRTVVTEATTTDELLASFDEAFEDRLYDRVHDAWQRLQRRRGAMDDMIDDLRRECGLHLDETLDETRQGADRLIADHAARGGLQTARSGLRDLRRSSQSLLDDAERHRRRAIERCQRHQLPDPSPIAASRRQVEHAAEEKPDRTPLIVGLVLWAVMAPTLGGPLMHSLAVGLNLHEQPNVFEWILGPFGAVLGAIIVFLPVFFLLRRHLRRATNRVRDAIGDLSSTVRDVVEGGRGDLFSATPSIRSFFAARLELTHALANRQFGDRLHDQLTCDNQLAFRLCRSVEIQQRLLRRRAEILGVRPRRADDDAARLDDDVTAIFGDPETKARLLAPERLLDYYHQHFGSLRDVDVVLPSIIEDSGGFERWRREACLADTDALLGYGRREFVDLVTTPVGARPSFETDVGRNLTDFVARHFANVGFGARFVGYEGFDATGLRRLAETSLVLHPRLRPTFDKACDDPEASPVSETLDVIEANIMPNTAYIMSLVQGIHARSIDNLQRHETFFDRLELPDPAMPWRDRPLTLVNRHAGQLPADPQAPPTEAIDAPRAPHDPDDTSDDGGPSSSEESPAPQTGDDEEAP